MQSSAIFLLERKLLLFRNIDHFLDTYKLLLNHCIGCSTRINRRRFVGQNIQAHVVYRNRWLVPDAEFPSLIARLDFLEIVMHRDQHLANMFGTL